jgi:protease II
MLKNIAVVYACKPYTDVLRTVTNKKLTQVIQESEEFGYVAEDPVGFMAIAKVSPYENVVDKPSKNPAVLLTGGLKDPEVEVYMPVKFAKRLHDAGWHNVVVRIADEGHFTESGAEHHEAHDAALCEYFLSNNK